MKRSQRVRLKVPKLKYGIAVDEVIRDQGKRNARCVTLSWEGRVKSFALNEAKRTKCIKSSGVDRGRVEDKKVLGEMYTQAAAILNGS